MPHNPHPDLASQYATDENLRIRIETHRLHTVGPSLEPAIDNALNLNPDESLLDIGTGPGDFPICLRKTGHRGRLVGVDNSLGMVAKAKSADTDIEFFHADARSLPFPDVSFDVVTARHMLYHVPDIPRALCEAHRVLRPGGRFLAVTNISNNFAEYRQALHEAADTLKGRIADVLRITVPASSLFNELNGPPMIHAVFGNVKTSLVEAALKFESPEPALRYFDSCRTMKGFNERDWAIARVAFGKIIATRFRSGPWMISKTAVLLSASKSPHSKNSI
jgi:SAM-dependent methyltransferase